MASPLDEFVAAARRRAPGFGEAYKIKRLGATAEMSENLLTLILSGEKTGTFTLPWLHGHHANWIPETDGLVVYTDFTDRPRALIRQDKPEFVSYADITAAHTACEGPGARDLDTWRKIHWPYWTALLAPHGLKPLPDMPVCVERFKLLHPRA